MLPFAHSTTSSLVIGRRVSGTALKNKYVLASVATVAKSQKLVVSDSVC